MKKINLLIVLLLCLLLAGCTETSTPVEEAAPPVLPAEPEGMYLYYSGQQYIKLNAMVENLPEGFTSAGQVTGEMQGRGDGLGAEYFTDGPSPEVLYLYQIYDTIYASPTVEGEDQYAYGYIPWIRRDLYDPESVESDKRPVLMVQLEQQHQTRKPSYYPTGFAPVGVEDFVLQTAGEDVLRLAYGGETLTVEETRGSDTVTHQLKRDADGYFRLPVVQTDPAQKELVQYAVPFLRGRYIFHVELQPAQWGISMELSQVTVDGLTLTLSRSGGNPSGVLETGAWYVVQRWENENWQDVPELEREYPLAWIDIAYEVPHTFRIDWTDLYGSLPEGVYRIGKKVMDFRGTGDFDELVFHGEFEIGLKP